MPDPDRLRLASRAGLAFEFHPGGTLRGARAHGVALNLFHAGAAEGGPTNLWLRAHDGGGVRALPLLGAAPLVAADGALAAAGAWDGLRWRLALRLAEAAPAWFWHVEVENAGAAPRTLDLVLVHDVGLAPYAAIRINEYYVSHYVDLAPLAHARHGWALAARQNQAADGRHPWALVGSLGRAASFATDGRQVFGLGARAGAALPPGIAHGLPGTRLQHEHALVALEDERFVLAPGERARRGFFGHALADHPAASGAADLALVDATLALAEAGARVPPVPEAPPSARSLFERAPMLDALDLDEAALGALFGGARRHEERDGATLLSFFHGDQAHVVLRAKELRVQRPHGRILRSGAHLVPDERALTSTAWMGGAFHSMLTQGHVSANRLLSTVHGALGVFASHGQRVFVRVGGAWRRLGTPSAFEMTARGCRWIYRHAGGAIEVASEALDAPEAMGLALRVLEGEAVELLVTHHVAAGGDDGLAPLPLPLAATDREVEVGLPAGSELARRFPRGRLRLEAAPGTRFARVGGDELLYDDGRARGEPFVCLATGPVASFGLRLVGALVDAAPVEAEPLALPRWQAPAASPLAAECDRLAEITPWFAQDALVHFLAPRGLEQYTGGGWGTRDVCQGPLEMLLALDRPAPVRDLLRRVFAAQDGAGDWPQWFMFFERDRSVRASDAHGDVVYWPLLGLARYLLATGDAVLLDEALPFHAPDGVAAEAQPLWAHVERALDCIAARRIAGTRLPAYGHGDWNDSLQPADPALRERLCSAWTATLHHQTFATLARALRAVGRAAAAAPLDAEADALRDDFRRLLMPGGVVAGYALFEPGAPPEMLLHPDDRRTGIACSLLPLMHAVLADLLAPDEARATRALIERRLLGPDGARLFDRPLPYRGGPERLFRRAESSAFFGREIGLMYMHAHLRWAEMLAHLGEAERFLAALALAHPIALAERVPSASPRQANCYYTSSDAAFADRYEAAREYARVAAGRVALDGGWRVYSSGPGLFVALVAERFLGLRRAHDRLVVDPVLPRALDGLRATTTLEGRPCELEIRVGAAGCGPRTVELNGAALPFARGANPYRTGAAEVALAELRPRLQEGANRLVVRLG